MIQQLVSVDTDFSRAKVSKKNLLKFEKITEEDIKLVGGLFKTHDTYGLPLEISTFIFSERNVVRFLCLLSGRFKGQFA